MTPGRTSACRPSPAATRRGGSTPRSRRGAPCCPGPEPALAIVNFGRRDVPFDQDLPIPFSRAPPVRRHERRRRRRGRREAERPARVLPGRSGGHGSSPATSWDAASRIPCTAFDKWRVIPVLDDEDHVDRRGRDLLLRDVRPRYAVRVPDGRSHRSAAASSLGERLRHLRTGEARVEVSAVERVARADRVDVATGAGATACQRPSGSSAPAPVLPAFTTTSVGPRSAIARASPSLVVPRSNARSSSTPPSTRSHEREQTARSARRRDRSPTGPTGG